VGSKTVPYILFGHAHVTSTSLIWIAVVAVIVFFGVGLPFHTAGRRIGAVSSPDGVYAPAPSREASDSSGVFVIRPGFQNGIVATLHIVLGLVCCIGLIPAISTFQSGDFAGGFVRLAFGLAFLVAFLAVLSWLLRRPCISVYADFVRMSGTRSSGVQRQAIGAIERRATGIFFVDAAHKPLAGIPALFSKYQIEQLAAVLGVPLVWSLRRDGGSFARTRSSRR
jgi:hypothetical protein